MIAETPFLSVVMPVRNEARFIERALASVLSQDWPDDRWEVLVVDGMSSDGTAERAEAVARRLTHGVGGPSVRVIENPKRIVPTGMNLAIEQARGEFIVRVDGHCELEEGYLRRVVDVLIQTRADCVGGVCVTVGSTPTAAAIAAAQSSKMGVGNVAFRAGESTAKQVDSVPFGAFPREVFARLGGFDEELVRNQDDEFTFRILQHGGVVWFDPTIRSRYHSRATLGSLVRQYHDYGMYKVLVAKKRGGFASARHLVPGAFVGAVAVGGAVTAATARVRWLAAPLIPYLLVTVLGGRRLARRRGVVARRTITALWALHLGYGAGFWHGVWRWRNR